VDLTGKTVLVTGAGGSGVGFGVCRAVREAGGRLVVNELRPEDVEAAAETHGAEGAFAADISSAGQVEEMFARIAERFGKVDGLVNNAGVGLSRPAHEASPQEFDRLHGIDLRGLWLVSRAFARQALGQGGAIVNVSSVHARATMNGYAIYAAAKAGVEGLTRGMAVELGAGGIRCNAIAPGYVHSRQNLELIANWSADPEGWVRDHTYEQQALPREIEPVDCGWATVFLLSERSRCITGQVLGVDAGMTAMLYNRGFV
jgi:NAD(P)-dependent dehydrogenase (short-subunit alcohol dehydrogenase family)